MIFVRAECTRPQRRTTHPDSCESCGAWVTGGVQCLVCRLRKEEIADPHEWWQLVALLETDLMVKRMSAQVPVFFSAAQRTPPSSPPPILRRRLAPQFVSE